MATEKKTLIESNPMNIATISAGFEKGDFLVREEQGNRVYFDFFEEVRRTSVDVAPCSSIALFLTNLSLVAGIQLHFQQRLFAHVTRGREALGGSDECYPRQCQGRHEVQHWYSSNGALPTSLGCANPCSRKGGKATEKDHDPVQGRQQGAQPLSDVARRQHQSYSSGQGLKDSMTGDYRKVLVSIYS
jgi:hypothetical protein